MEGEGVEERTRSKMGRDSLEREQDGQPREGEKESGHGCFCPSN